MLLLLLLLPAMVQSSLCCLLQNATLNGGVPSSPVANTTDALVGLRNKTYAGEVDHCHTHVAVGLAAQVHISQLHLLPACMQLHSSRA